MVYVVDVALAEVARNLTLEPEMSASNVPKLDPVLTVANSVIDTVVPSWTKCILVV